MSDDTMPPMITREASCCPVPPARSAQLEFLLSRRGRTPSGAPLPRPSHNPEQPPADETVPCGATLGDLERPFPESCPSSSCSSSDPRQDLSHHGFYRRHSNRLFPQFFV